MEKIFVNMPLQAQLIFSQKIAFSAEVKVLQNSLGKNCSGVSLPVPVPLTSLD